MIITILLSVIISIIFNVYMNISHDYNKAIKVKKDKKYNAEKYAASGKKINIKEIIYYLITIVTLVLSSMIGINFKKQKNKK